MEALLSSSFDYLVDNPCAISAKTTTTPRVCLSLPLPPFLFRLDSPLQLKTLPCGYCPPTTPSESAIDMLLMFSFFFWWKEISHDRNVQYTRYPHSLVQPFFLLVPSRDLCASIQNLESTVGETLC